MPDSQQLNFSFEGDRRLRENILAGRFLYFLEITPPSGNHQIDNALALARERMVALGNLPDIFGFTVNDRPEGQDTLPPLPFALELSRQTGKPVTLTISGAGNNLNDCRSLIAEARSQGICNFFATTGVLPADGTLPDDFTDSLDIISEGQNKSELVFGAAVNPYQYLPEGQCLQYARMIQKLQAGATFIVCQSGWDMMKAQELQWFIQKRSLGVPVIARICYFTPENALALGEKPVTSSLPLPIAALLINEAKELSEEEFAKRQLDRLALQIAGYRKLGFAGCQIAGLTDPSLLAGLFAKVNALDDELTEYKTWLTRWQDTFGCYNFAPLLNPHYLFKGLMRPEYPEYDSATTKGAGIPLLPPSGRDSLTYRFWRTFWRQQNPGSLCRLFEKISGRADGRNAYLEPCAFLDNRSCPKKLTYGACGGIRTDGTCEDGSGHLCFFFRVLRVLDEADQLDKLETLPESIISQNDIQP